MMSCDIMYRWDGMGLPFSDHPRSIAAFGPPEALDNLLRILLRLHERTVCRQQYFTIRNGSIVNESFLYAVDFYGSFTLRRSMIVCPFAAQEVPQ